MRSTVEMSVWYRIEMSVLSYRTQTGEIFVACLGPPSCAGDTCHEVSDDLRGLINRSLCTLNGYASG